MRPLSTRTFPLPLLAALVVLVSACSDGTAPRHDPEPIERGDYELLVERLTRAGERSWYTMTLDGSRVWPLGGFPRDAITLVPSPDGRTIAWLRETELDVHLWAMDRDGGTRRPILEGAVVVHHAAWSPDGERLVLAVSTLEVVEDIWVIDADGGTPTRLTPDPLRAIVVDRNPLGGEIEVGLPGGKWWVCRSSVVGVSVAAFSLSAARSNRHADHRPTD